MSVKHDLAGSVFIPSSSTVSIDGWLQAPEHLHEGAEAGPIGFISLDLRLMDTYMRGVVRWLNYIGITTALSCDGHGREAPWLQLSTERDYRALSACLAAISAGQWRYDVDSHRLMSEDSNSPGSVDRTWLLDLAEALYRPPASSASLWRDSIKRVPIATDGGKRWTVGQIISNARLNSR